MKLYKPDEGPAGDYIQDYGEEATLDDIKAWAKGMDLAVVPLEPTDTMKTRGMVAHQDCNHSSQRQCARHSYIAMIKAAGEGGCS